MGDRQRLAASDSSTQRKYPPPTRKNDFFLTASLECWYMFAVVSPLNVLY